MEKQPANHAAAISDRTDGVTEQIPATLDGAPYLVSNVHDIHYIQDCLHALATSGATVTLHLPEGEPQILGHLVEAGQDTPEGCFVFKMADDAMVPPGTWAFTAEVRGIKLQFSCECSGSAAAQATLNVAFPEMLIELQRRRFVRIITPLGQPFSAEFSIGGRGYALSVDDLALGGVGLRASPQEAALLYVGRKLPRVQLALGNDELWVVDLAICSRRAWHSYLLGKTFHVGCRFTEIEPTGLAGIQRVLDQLSADALNR